uniref:Uncharacterized protein n=1 Tax=Pseudictyota dubia TaxID=2749911 RepID=A0A7R9VCD3_9STRA
MVLLRALGEGALHRILAAATGGREGGTALSPVLLDPWGENLGCAAPPLAHRAGPVGYMRLGGLRPRLFRQPHSQACHNAGGQQSRQLSPSPAVQQGPTENTASCPATSKSPTDGIKAN